MNTPALVTKRLILRRFTEKDMKALFLILKDEEVNKFLPWYPLKNLEAMSMLIWKNIMTLVMDFGRSFGIGELLQKQGKQSKNK